jgi:hypothetical protein
MTANHTENTMFANYCGNLVEVVDVYTTQYGTLALVAYDDGREEEIPYVRLEIL